MNTYVYANNNPILPYSTPKARNELPEKAYRMSMHSSKIGAQKGKRSDPLSFSVGLLTPETGNIPSWMDVYAFYINGSLGWGYTFGEGYSLASFSVGILDATFHLPKWFGSLPDDHLANPNIFLGVGTWNVNASIGLGVSGTAEILSGTIGVQFGDSISFGVKGYIGVGFTFDLTNGIRFGWGLGLGYEFFLAIDWYELFN